jgi:hypothetical protein
MPNFSILDISKFDNFSAVDEETIFLIEFLSVFEKSII